MNGMSHCTENNQFGHLGSKRQRHLEEVLHPLGVVAVALPADSLHFLDLTRFARRLDVLEVNIGLLAEIDDGAEEVEQA